MGSRLQKRLLTLLFVLLAALATPSIAMAQSSDSGEEEEEGNAALYEGPSIRRQNLLRKGRFELQPVFGSSLNGTFSNSFLIGINAGYYFTNSFGIGATFNFAVANLDTDETTFVAERGDEDGVASQLNIAELNLAIDVGVNWAPIAGKLSFFKLADLAYDIHFFAGVGALSFGARCADEANNQCQTFDDSDVPGFKIGAAVGGGGRLYINNFLAINIEFRDYLVSYAEYARSPNDATSEFRNFFTLQAGFSFFLPTDVFTTD